MYVRALPLAFLALVAGQVAGNELHVRSTIKGLLARQTGLPNVDQIPEQCQSDCAAMLDAENCADLDCLCGEKTHSDLGACLNCAIGLEGVTEEDKPLADAAIKQYEEACNSAGYNLQPITLGENGAGAVAVSSGAVVGAISVAVAALVF
ncbi:hypothetical protein C8Q76DRAFT_738424 [Earliella scabrosa]|nr:hypothetical protein C8Q76DRAFT_738424 [Earliella scabrosa]